MMRVNWLGSIGMLGVLLLCTRVTAQAVAPAEASAAASLPVLIRVEASGIDPAALRGALSSELGVALEPVTSAPGGQAHLMIEGSRLEALRVAFVRADATSVERTLDLSSMRSQANEALALLAANLIRDEASELLARLRPATPPSAAAPQPTAADTERPPVLDPKPAAPPKRLLPRGCDERPDLAWRSFGADLVPFIGTTGRRPYKVERGFSLNVIGGMTGAVRGIELGSVFNIDVEGSCGLQLSGVINIVGGSSQGVQLAEINWTGGRLDGIQLGMLSMTKGDVHGAQLGLVNLTADDVSGVQAGLVNFAATGVQGIQAGLVNVNAARLDGFQLGLVNTSRIRTHGAQLGLANLSAGETQGAQVGLVNVGTGDVHGTMLGLVNVAENSDAAIGLVNVMWNGTTKLDVWGTDAGLGLVGIRHGARRTHSIYGVGATGRDGRLVLATALGFGVSALQRDPFFVDIDAVGYGLYTDVSQAAGAMSLPGGWKYGWIVQLRIPVGYQLTSGIALFVSPALNISIAKRENNPFADPALIGSNLLTQSDAKLAVRIWPGFTAGLRFF